MAQAQAQAELNGLIQQDAEKNRVAVHSFDPDASPEEKAAAAGKGRDKLKNVNAGNGAGGQELAINAGKSSVIPTITIQDTDKLATDAQAASAGPSQPQPSSHLAPAVTPVPGAMPDGAAPPIPDWYKIGWRAASGIDDAPLPEGEAKDRAVLDLFLSDAFYGDWYHNAALVVFAVFTSHFLTRFGFGWGWLFILLAICNTYYTTSMARVRRRARDDIQRELVKQPLASEHESAEWLNNFLDRFWLIYEPVLSATVVSSVDQILSTNTPPFLDSLRLSTFTLGTKAPRIDRVRTFPRTEDDVVMMDWGLSFTPNDISDLTPKQAAKKVNPKIVLSIRVGKGLATAAMPVLLEDITFSGLMRIRMKLMTSFPHVQIVDISFLEKPVIDYVLKPIGGDTFGIDIAHLPGLSSFIRDMVHATLGPMMYEPNKFTLNLEQLLSGAPIDTAIGVLQVTVQSARSLKGVKLGGGSPDPFVSFSISQRAELAKTRYKHNTYNPTWNETKFLLINSLGDSLVMTVFDYNDHRKNTELGSVLFDLNQLHEDATKENLESMILKDGKERGMLRYEVNFYPVLKPQVVDGAEQPVPETNVGIVRLTLHQAKDLDHTKSMSGDLNPFSKVYLGDATHPTLTTSRFKHTNNPVWETPTEFLCSDRLTSTVTVKVIDDRDFLKDPVVGYLSVKIDDVIEATKAGGRDWWPLSGCKTGRLRMSAEWKPLDMAGSLHGADQYAPPIGVVRLWLQKATDVKNVEAALGGKSDPYVRVQVGNVTKGRTEVINNNLNPEWDQIVYIPVHSLRETLLLECMDYQHLTKDRSLGSVELRVAELAQASPDKQYPFSSTGKQQKMDQIKLDRGAYKGQLHYVAEFIPALALKGVKFDAAPNELERAIEGGEEDDGDEVVDDAGVFSSKGEERQDVPRGVTVTRPMEEEAEMPAHKKNSKSTDSIATSSSAGTHVTAQTSGTHKSQGPTSANPEEGVELPKADLLAHQSGVVVFNITGGHLYKKARLEVLLDDGYWPAFSTTRARSANAQWDMVGEGFLKELDFGRVWLRLNDADEGDKDDVIAEWKGDAKAFLEKTLDGPTSFTLADENGEKQSTVQIEARFVPVPVQLEARESINNQGVLRVELIEGRDIHAADRGGKSDPFAVFSLNGQKVFKSQTKKKTLNPDWNESFTVSVPSRVGADFSVEIFDWNQIEQAKSLGSSKIELAEIEPFQGLDRLLHLSHPKHGDKGEIRVRMLFQPEIIAKSRKNTSTFSTAGRAVTQIGSMPIAGGKGVVTGVGKVGKIFTRDHAKSDALAVPDELPNGQASHPVETNAATESQNAPPVPVAPALTSFPSNGGNANGGHNAEPGTLRVVVMSGKDLSSSGDVKPYVTVRVGDKEQKSKHQKSSSPEWNESFTFTAGSFTPKMYFWVHDHKTIGKDKLLGEGEVDLWQHLQPGQTNAADVATEVKSGQGLLNFRMEFDADNNPGTRSPSPSSIQRQSTFHSPSRFSLSRRRGPQGSDD